MSRSVWLVDNPGDDDAGNYVVVACIEAHDWLYTFVSCPYRATPMPMTIETRLPSGEVLPWRAFQAAGSDRGEIAIARGATPPIGTDELLVTVRVGDDVVAETRLIRAGI